MKDKCPECGSMNTSKVKRYPGSETKCQSCGHIWITDSARIWRKLYR